MIQGLTVVTLRSRSPPVPASAFGAVGVPLYYRCYKSSVTNWERKETELVLKKVLLLNYISGTNQAQGNRLSAN